MDRVGVHVLAGDVRTYLERLGEPGVAQNLERAQVVVGEIAAGVLRQRHSGEHDVLAGVLFVEPDKSLGDLGHVSYVVRRMRRELADNRESPRVDRFQHAHSGPPLVLWFADQNKPVTFSVSASTSMRR